MIFLIIFIIIFAIYISFLYIYRWKIKKLEQHIQELFISRNNLIPSIYDITKQTVSKHEEIFKNILILRKKDFSENNFFSSLDHKIKTYEQIHNELNFIFKITNKHPSLLKNKKFLYLRDLIIDISYKISQNIWIYKRVRTAFNKYLGFKNITILGLLFPIDKVEKI